MRARLLVPFAFLLLGGCAGLSPQAVRAQDEASCRSYGFKPRTQAFSECLQRIDLDRRADRRAFLYGDMFYRQYRW